MGIIAVVTARLTKRAVVNGSVANIGIQSGCCQLHGQAIQDHRPKKSLAMPDHVGQQQTDHGRRHIGNTGSQAIKPWTHQPFQIRQTLKARHLDDGHGGCRHGDVMATLQFGDGAEQTQSMPNKERAINTPPETRAVRVGE